VPAERQPFEQQQLKLEQLFELELQQQLVQLPQLFLCEQQLELEQFQLELELVDALGGKLRGLERAPVAAVPARSRLLVGFSERHRRRAKPALREQPPDIPVRPPAAGAMVYLVLAVDDAIAAA
jgi:hypothetical protein